MLVFVKITRKDDDERAQLEMDANAMNERASTMATWKVRTGARVGVGVRVGVEVS